jgi:hypothetical protein
MPCACQNRAFREHHLVGMDYPNVVQRTDFWQGFALSLLNRKLG